MRQPSIQKKNIQPIGAWKNKYGKRGAFTDFLLETFKNAYPGYYQLNELAPLVIAEFSLPYSSEEAQRAWIRDFLRSRIKVLTTQGFLERGEDVRHLNRNHGTWRLKMETPPTLKELSRLKGRNRDT